MRTTLVMLLAGAGLIVATTRTSAHHAFAAEFDASKPIKLRGTVVKMEWINPHTWIHLDVKTPKGTVERWMIEGGPPNALYRRGFTQKSLPQGSEIVVEGFRAKDGSLRGNGRDLTFADGRRLFVGSSGTGAPRDGRTTSEKWVRRALHRSVTRAVSAERTRLPSGFSRSAPISTLFSAHTYSWRRVPSRSINVVFTVHGFVSTFGSSIVMT